MTGPMFRRACIAALTTAAALAAGNAVSGVAALAGPTAFKQLRNQNPEEGLPNFYIQPRTNADGIAVLRVAMMAKADSGNPDASTKTDFVLACAKGSGSSFYEQVNRDKGAFAHESVFRTFDRSGKLKVVTVTRLWRQDGSDDALVYAAQWAGDATTQFESLVRVTTTKLPPRAYGKATDDLVRFTTMAASRVAPKHNCKYSPPMEIDDYVGSMLSSGMKVKSEKDQRVLWFSAADAKGTPFKAVIGRKFDGPAKAADKAIPAKLELFGDINGMFSYKPDVLGFVSSVKFTSLPGSQGMPIAKQGDAVKEVLFERLGMPQAEGVESNADENGGKGEKIFRLLWPGVRFEAKLGSNKVMAKTTPVSWEVEFSQSPQAKLPRPE